MIAAARLARGQAMRVLGEQRAECVLDQLRLAGIIDRREHEAGLAYRHCWRSIDTRKRALCGAIDQELELRVDYDAPLILRCATVHRDGIGVRPHSAEGLERLRRCLSRAATVIETICGEPSLAAD